MKDHRQIGREMDLFTFSELSPGCPIWLPNGNIIYTILQDKIRELQKNYLEVRTPVLWKTDLYKISGHMEHYKDNMFFLKSDDVSEYAMKPMNCPGHMEIYKSKGARPITELPLRIADQGMLHRNECSGSLGGLTRCRSFCQDDAHIFLTIEQIDTEVTALIAMIRQVYEKFAMPIRVVLSTRPSNFIGNIEVWNKVESNLHNIMDEIGCEFTLASEEGAFYGPKIDFFVKDSLNREWQTATIQLDFQLPSRFGLEYVDHNNERKTPIVIHRAIYGSLERFIGILLEHFQGHLPIWLAPIQYIVLPITSKVKQYCLNINSKLEKLKIRSIVDASGKRLPQMIAIAQSAYIPRMLIIGDREMENETVTVRKYNGTNETLAVENFFFQTLYDNKFTFEDQ